MNGLCPKCHVVIVRKNHLGKYAIPTPAYANVFIVLSKDGNEGRLKVPICKSCALTVSAEELWEVYKHNPASADYLGFGMTPLKIEGIK